MSCAIGNPFGTWMNHMWSTPFWGMGWWMIIWALALVAIGYGIYYALFRPRSYGRREKDPIEIARIWLARGEITAEEFEEIKKKLAASRPGSESFSLTLLVLPGKVILDDYPVA